MDATASSIMSEVDELLGKLDTLPADVRVEVLNKLSLKVSTSRASKGNNSGRGRSRGRVATRSKIVSVKKDSIKKTNNGELSSRISNEIVSEQAKKVPTSFEEFKTNQSENIITSGRRHTRKVDYKQLSECGLNTDIKQEITDDVKIQPFIRRGRGRSKKNAERVTTTHCDSNENESITIKKEIDIDTSHKEDELDIAGSLDLLESCLKESGIKSIEEKTEPHESIEEVISTELTKTKDEEVVADVGATKKVLIFDSVESINNLPKKKTTNANYKCHECGKMYCSMSVLKTHQVRHLKKEDLPFACKHCNFRSASKIELFRHTLKHEKSLVYTCDICNKNFARDTGLREHIEFVHAKSEVLKCGLCQFTTHRRKTMKCHLLTHQGTAPVIACPICGVTFRAKSNLRTHLYSHAGLKRFECDECGKKFIMKNRLQAHKNYVHSPKDHNCPFCEMKFPTKHALKRHILIHTGEKPFKCCFCAFMCNTQGNLIKHIRRLHDKINFTYKDFLKESGKNKSNGNTEPEVMEKMQKEGKDFAEKVFHTFGNAVGETLSLEQMKNDLKKKNESKVAALQEQHLRKRKKIFKKTICTGTNVGKDKKIPIYPLDDKSGPSVSYFSGEDNVFVEAGLNDMDENPCWLTHTDENGCVMLIPWDVSLINDDEVEDNEWREDLHVDKIVKITNNSSNVPADVSKADDISISNIEDECNGGSLETALEISRDIRAPKRKTEISQKDDLMVRDLCEVVNDIDSLNVGIAVETSRSLDSPDKNIYKQLPKTLQVIATNPSGSNVSPSVSNFVLPDGYILDDEGQVLQLTSNVMDTNLLQLQMGQVMNSPDSPEVTIDKLTDNVYSFVSQGSGDKGRTFVITTREGDNDLKLYDKMTRKGFDPNVNLLPIEGEEEGVEGLVLIVDANDVDT